MPSIYEHLAKNSNHPNPIDLLVTPSWVSALIGIVFSLIIVFGSLGLVYYRSSALQTLINLDQSQNTKVEPTVTSTQSDRLAVIISDIPLFIFWAGVGIAAYTFTAAVGSSFRSVAELEEEMSYVHVKRRELLMYAAERFALRMGALGLWLAVLNFTIHHILPYAAALSYASTSAGSWIYGILFVLAAIVVLIIVSHVHTLLLRLITLRPRIFG